MGFFLALLYTVLSLLSPAELFPALAPYRIMVWLAALALLASLPGMFSQRWLKRPHIYLMMAFVVSICASRLFNGWFGGVPLALQEFLPSAMIFFLLLWNVSTLNHVRILSIVLIVISIYAVGRGIYAYHTDNTEDEFGEFQPMQVDAGTVEAAGLIWYAERLGYIRIRSLGVLNDPNDFAQYLLILLPLLLPFWKKGYFIGNFFRCLLPAAILLYGVYLTNSRGGLLALAVLLLFLAKDRIGWKGMALMSPLIIIGILALNQSGRQLSLTEGSAQGRVDAWSDGIGMFKSSPLWGVGYGEFTAYHERTAHNSFVLCLSELGLIGTFFWVGLIVACVKYLHGFAQQFDIKDTNEGRWAFALQASLFTALVTSWFLSRTYSPTFYLSLGMAAALSMVHLDPAPAEGPAPRWALTTIGLIPLLFSAVYITVRYRWA